MVLKSHGNERGISLIYLALAESMEKTSYMLGWERDLDFEWDLDTWLLCFIRSFKGLHNISLIEANLKVISHWYMVPTRLAKIYLADSPLCFRECGHTGSLLHIFWQCPRIRGFWNQIFSFNLQDYWSTPGSRDGSSQSTCS